MFSKILNVNLCYWKFLLLLCYNSVICLFHPKSGRAAGKSTTFWPKVAKWSIFRPSDHFFFFSKSGRSGDQATTSGRSPKKCGRFAGKTTTFWQKVARSGRFAGKPTTLGVGLALCRHYCCYETLVLSYCCYETLVLCYCCYGILVLLCCYVITVQQCYAVNVRQL